MRRPARRPGPSPHPTRGVCGGVQPRRPPAGPGGADRALRVWDVATGRLLATWSGHTEPVWASPSARTGSASRRRRATGRSTDQLGEVNIWDATTGRLLHALRAHQGIARSVAFSPDGRRLVSGGGEHRTPGQEVIVWDVATGTKCARFPTSRTGSAGRVQPGRPADRGRGRAGGPDLGCGDRGEIASRCEGHTDEVTGPRLQPRRPAAGLDERGRDHPCLGRRQWTIVPCPAADKFTTHGVAIHPDGTRFASAGSDQTVKLWDVADRPAVDRPQGPYRLHLGRGLQPRRPVHRLVGRCRPDQALGRVDLSSPARRAGLSASHPQG